MNILISQSLYKTNCIVSDSFYAKVSHLHVELYNSPATALTNPLVAFTLIKRLQSEWLNVVSSNKALENAQGSDLASLQSHLLVKRAHPPASAVITRPPFPRSPFDLALSSPQVRLRGERGPSSHSGGPPGGRQRADEAAGCLFSPGEEPRKGTVPEGNRWQEGWRLPARGVSAVIWWWLLPGWKGTCQRFLHCPKQEISIF